MAWHLSCKLMKNSKASQIYKDELIYEGTGIGMR